ncbi:MAG: serine/threonine protein kinase [Proteobacteria bacterium]|nr:serine/threonine protein kinase [Pseudomonadota bacterium]MBU1717360.1 serine/threonine protein kinase [Pseudomonadota bacterium]
MHSRKIIQFHNLNPDLVINLAEKNLGATCTNLCRPLNSYINRVFELQLEDGEGVVAKFYRPGRWSKTAIQEEHDFLLELTAHEIAVIAPLTLQNGLTLGQEGNMFFALFPKKSGRNYDEFMPDQWLELGRLMGRVHMIGAAQRPKERLTMTPKTFTGQQVNFILEGELIPAELKSKFFKICNSFITENDKLFKKTEMIRIHGDCHFTNIIYRPGESFFLIDFDDMVVGPPIQDLWMLLPDLPENSLREIDLFLEGYETFRKFDLQSINLIEPLRAMRFIHFTAWCAHQATEEGFAQLIQGWGTPEFWQQEIAEMEDQLTRIKERSNLASYFT